MDRRMYVLVVVTVLGLVSGSAARAGVGFEVGPIAGWTLRESPSGKALDMQHSAFSILVGYGFRFEP
jgi:hypothetical protein